METNKQAKSAVLIYMLLLLIFGCMNFIRRRSIFDLIYFIIILCCGIKYLKHIRK